MTNSLLRYFKQGFKEFYIEYSRVYRDVKERFTSVEYDEFDLQDYEKEIQAIESFFKKLGISKKQIEAMKVEAHKIYKEENL